MKTYRRRDPNAVEPQNRQRKPLPHPLHSDPGVTATVTAICRPSRTAWTSGLKVRVIGVAGSPMFGAGLARRLE